MRNNFRKRNISPEYNLVPLEDPGDDKKSVGEGGGYINMDTMSQQQQQPQKQHLGGFNKLLALTEGVGVAVVVMIVVWCGRKGFAWRSNPALEFNLHPLCMVLGLVFLNANAILTFRVLRSNPKPTLKLIHGGLQLLTLPLTVVGLVAVFDSHNLAATPMANLYTLHSWLGLSAVILFATQWVFGLTTFLFPGLSADIRAFVLPIHVFSGVFIFILSVGASLVGLNEKAIWAVPNYNELPGEAVLVNLIGIFLVIFAALVGFVVTKAEYKRTPLPGDGSPLLSFSRQ